MWRGCALPAGSGESARACLSVSGVDTALHLPPPLSVTSPECMSASSVFVWGQQSCWRGIWLHLQRPRIQIRPHAQSTGSYIDPRVPPVVCYMCHCRTSLNAPLPPCIFHTLSGETFSGLKCRGQSKGLVSAGAFPDPQPPSFEPPLCFLRGEREYRLTELKLSVFASASHTMSFHCVSWTSRPVGAW